MSNRKQKREQELREYEELMAESRKSQAPQDTSKERLNPVCRAEEYVCPKCGEKLPFRKSTCPKCGYDGYVPMSEAEIKRVRGILFVIAAVALVVILIIRNA
jgi:hypothetical protein